MTVVREILLYGSGTEDLEYFLFNFENMASPGFSENNKARIMTSHFKKDVQILCIIS